NISEIIKVSYSWAKQYVSFKRGTLTEPRRSISMPYLTGNWVCLDIDGSIRNETDSSYDNVLVQTNSLKPTKAIKENSSNSSNSALIKRIHQIL
ncbi:hypothetical protein Goshw_028393, partial [Gossypium schwendimanii]|nr:hypothetical protein [Gossypium schwendimanii]